MQDKPLMIYRDGQFSRWETYKPVIYAMIVTLTKRHLFLAGHGR
jgi:hypothetical protein